MIPRIAARHGPVMVKDSTMTITGPGGRGGGGNLLATRLATRRFVLCLFVLLPYVTNSMISVRRTIPTTRGYHPTGLGAFFDDGGGGGDPERSPSSSSSPGGGKNGNNGRVNGVIVGVGTNLPPRRNPSQSPIPLDPKDEALIQAQTAVSSLESALNSAVGSLENMQRQLQLRVTQLEKELENARDELAKTRMELSKSNNELASTRDELAKSRGDVAALEMALSSSEGASRRVEQLEAYVSTLLEENRNSEGGGGDGTTETANNGNSNNPWQIFSSSNQRVIPVLNDWIAIRGSNEGEVQISGKVSNHPTIPDGDAIVTSPLVDAGKAVEKKIITTLSGSKYRLATPMTLPASSSASVKITSGSSPSIAGGKKSSISSSSSPRRQALVRTRSSISIPDLTGGTIGNGRYLLAGEATSSINGRSFIQTAYRASSYGKPVGEPLVVKYSQNKEAMKREYANYQKVSLGLKGSSFVKRAEFLPVAGEEMPDMSALVMQRGVADVKAFMPKVGGKLEGELLLDCALTALRCVDALHSVRLVWNDLKTENFVVIDDQRGGITFRGIDLESCMTVKTAPVDYTPEACPPEFARSFLKGEADTFGLEYSYDVWSLGMFMYEISTGRGFFDGMSAQKITMTLPTFEPNLDKVADPVLSDLISQCLSRDPKDRPTVARIFKHPFFADASTGKNAFDFLFGIGM